MAGQQLVDPRRVHAGALYDVFHAAIGDQQVAVKRPIATADRDRALATAWDRSGKTSLIHGQEFGWPSDQPALPSFYMEALLAAEHDVTRRAAEFWNHPGVEMVRWGRDDRLAPPEDEAAGPLCLVMPWCHGTPIASLTRTEQRRWFPSMLPALWDSLSEVPHGDLSLDDLVLERERGIFRIFDPGVSIEGPASSQGEWWFSSRLMTTNAARYPLIPPEHGPGAPRRCAPSKLADAMGRWFPRPGAVRSMIGPSVADLVACGAMYFEILAERSLLSLLELRQPAWLSKGHEADVRSQAPKAPWLDALAWGAIPRALQAVASPAEIALCELMVLGELDRDALMARMRDVLYAYAPV